MILIIFALLGSVIGVTTHVDTLQFQQIENLNEKMHILDKQVAVLNERVTDLLKDSIAATDAAKRNY